MSYDLQVWSTGRSELPHALPDAAGWLPECGTFTWQGHGWQIVVGPCHGVEAEDVPDTVQQVLVGVGFLTELNLEPLGAPRAAHALLRRTARALATSAHGAIVDPQADAVSTPGGVRRLVAPPRSRVVDAVQLSWFSQDEHLRSREWLADFVSLLHRRLPEALPVRYGQHEPPQHRLRETGTPHLVEFLTEEYVVGPQPGFGVWCPSSPVLAVGLSLCSGPSACGWRAHRVTLSVAASILRQPGWTVALQRLWREIAHLARVFYADVRTLKNQRQEAATYDEWLSAARHPVCSSFWAGIPSDGGHAAALGPPYLDLWSEFCQAGHVDGDLVVLMDDDWTRSGDVFARVGGVPATLVADPSAYAVGSHGPNLDRKYPPTWPFGEGANVT